MFIHNPDPFLQPTFRIGAFTTHGIERNAGIKKNFANFAQQYFNERFGMNNWLLTYNGREAIRLALSKLLVEKDSKVKIFTTSQNSYISSCVTSEIENFCHHTRSGDGDVLFVNHEFGYVYENMTSLVELDKPLIEDCCTTFFSQDSASKIGMYGDFSVYSFPKFFNIQIGGLLVGQGVGTNEKLISNSSVSSETADYIRKVVGFELSRKEELLEKRYNIFQYAKTRFEELGFSLRFPERLGEVPSVLLLNNHGIIKDLQQHKDYLNKHGIQNSVFYGEDAFFLPCHQNLSKVDVDYFRFVTENFIENE